LLVRYKENQKEERIRLNATTKAGYSQNFIDSVLSVFRVNFFKRKQDAKEKQAKTITKPTPESRTTQKKIAKKNQNKQRKLKHRQILREKKKEQQKNKQNVNLATKA
jgi:hypothetical protein